MRKCDQRPFPSGPPCMAKKGSSLWIPGKDSDFTVSYITAAPLVDLNHASELYSDPRLTLQREADQKAAPRSHLPQSQGSRNMDPAKMDWGFCQASLISHDQASVMTDAQEAEPL